MGKPGATGLTRIINAAGYSWLGLKAAYKHESAFRQELWLAIFMIPIGAYIGETLITKAVLVTSVLFVLVVELLNSSIEAVVDRVGNDPHELSGRAKDMGSAAVMISLVMTGLIWAAVILEQYQLLS